MLFQQSAYIFIVGITMIINEACVSIISVIAPVKS